MASGHASLCNQMIFTWLLMYFNQNQYHSSSKNNPQSIQVISSTARIRHLWIAIMLQYCTTSASKDPKFHSVIIYGNDITFVQQPHGAMAPYYYKVAETMLHLWNALRIRDELFNICNDMDEHHARHGHLVQGISLLMVAINHSK